jgi:hypothetical protein
MSRLLKVFSLLVLTISLASLAGCKSDNSNGDGEKSPSKPKPATNPSVKPIRIDAGSTTPTTDADGNQWLADTGFSGGGSVDRGQVQIAGTRHQAMYRTEHWGMNSFSMPVPNGRYKVVMHFAETYAGVTQPGQRVFSIKVEDQQIKDLDILKEAGAANKALVKSVPVTVSDGKLDIAFTFGEQNPEINGIEIIPQ